MPLPTPRLPTASTSCLEFLGWTVSGDAMGVSEPGSPFFLASGGGGVGCGGGGSGAGAAFGSCGVDCGACVCAEGFCGVAWPAESCDCARATPEKSSAARRAPKSFGEVGCMICLPRPVQLQAAVQRLRVCKTNPETLKPEHPE